MNREWSWKKANIMAGLWCLAVGLAMMALWLAKPAELAAGHPAVFGMKFNAALAFPSWASRFCLPRVNSTACRR
jgi:hypothetical protein